MDNTVFIEGCRDFERGETKACEPLRPKDSTWQIKSEVGDGAWGYAFQRVVHPNAQTGAHIQHTVPWSARREERGYVHMRPSNTHTSRKGDCFEASSITFARF